MAEPRDAAGRRGGGRAGRPERKSFLLRLSPELMDELRAWAGHEFRSLNGQIEFLLRQALRRRKKGDDEP